MRTIKVWPTEAEALRRRKRFASEQVYVARLQGRLVPQPCERIDENNCLGRINAHHRNGYDDALDVVWLCARHHQYEHHEMRDRARYAKGATA